MSKTIVRRDAEGLRCQASGWTARPTLGYPPERLAMGELSRQFLADDLATRWHQPVQIEIDGQTRFAEGDHVTAYHIAGTVRARVYNTDHSEIWWVE